MKMQFIKDIITHIVEKSSSSSSFETDTKEPFILAKSSLERKLDTKKGEEIASRKKGNKKVITTPLIVDLAKILDEEAENIIEVVRSLKKLKKDSSKKKKTTLPPNTKRSS